MSGWTVADEFDALACGHAAGHLDDLEAADRAAQVARLLVADAFADESTGDGAP